MDPEKTTDGTHSDTPDAPTAAHFREAARLAASRVRTALAQGEARDQESGFELSLEEPVIDAEVFELAAEQHARTLSGRDAEQEQPEQDQPSKKAATSKVKGAAKKIAELEERLHLGARMLRAFESQIQRLEAAAHRAEEAEQTTATPDPISTTEAHELQAGVTVLAERVSHAIDASEEALLAIESAIERANTTAQGLANSLETAEILRETIDDNNQARTRLETQYDARAHAIQNRLDAALHTMEQKLARITAIEEETAQRIQRVEEQLTPESPKPSEQPKREPPIIEIEALDRRPIASPPPKQAEPATISIGTLSVDPKHLQRTERLQRYTERA